MLRAIARAHHWDFDNNWTQPQAAAHLAVRLAQEGVLSHVLTTLPPDAIDALHALRAADGVMPAYRFLDRFGPLRPYRPWRKDAPPTPWQAPASPAETLWYCGLIFQVHTISGKDIVLPQELRDILPTSLLPAPPTIRPIHPPVNDLILDMVHFLAFLQSSDTHLLHRRWLSPRAYRALNATLASPDPAVAHANSELQTGYLRFLHYLVDVAGLAALTHGVLKPTPFVAGWLDLTESACHQTLLSAWQTDLKSPIPVWLHYRLPGSPDFVTLLLDLLADLPGPAYHISHLARELDGRCLAAGVPPGTEPAGDLLRALLRGPLTWTGWLNLDSEEDIARLTSGALMPTLDVPAPSTQSAHLVITTSDAMVFSIPAPPARPPLRPLVELGLTVPRGEIGPTRHRELSRARVAAWLSCGLSRAWIYQTLYDLIGAPLPQPAVDRLTEWERDLGAVTLQQAVLLTVAEPAILAELAGRRTLRPILRDTLSPHHITVAPGEVARLVRALKHQGYTPFLGPEIRAQMTGGHELPESDTVIALDTGAAAHLWLALRVLLDLADLIHLSGIPPAGLLDHLGASLGPELATMEDLARDISDQIRDSLDGYTPFPAPLPNLDTDAIADALQTAIVDDQPLEIVYHTAGRGERTTRVVEPLRIEQRGGAAYLIAYCRLRQEERIFRVDRIERVTPRSDP
ncbi:MAG: WYL domain-containing protein [Anaerolineae bacterium]|nr:WYL domain-containing protein [Anaerolineae bacterium]